MNKHHNLPSIFVAMDFDSIDDAKNLALKIDPNKCGIKIGKELLTSSGPELVKWFHDQGFKTFLDLKYHDIPNTVSKACKSAARLGVSIVNVHALGGEEMMLSAKKGPLYLQLVLDHKYSIYCAYTNKDINYLYLSNHNCIG